MNILMTKLITGALIGISATSPLLIETVRDNLTTQIVESEVNSTNETLTKINKVITSSLYFINQKTENHFVYESYKSVNITLEKDLKDIKEKNGVEIKQEHLRRGDLVFYNDNDGLNVGLFNGTDSVIIVKNKAILLEKVDSLNNVFCKRIISQNNEEETVIAKEKEELKKQEEAKKKAEEEAKKKAEEDKKSENKKVTSVQSNESNSSSSNSTNGTPYFDSNGLLAMNGSAKAKKAINLLLGIPGHRNGKSYHQRTGLDDLINSLSVEEATYVIRKIEGSGFGQTSDGFAGVDSHVSHSAFLNRQVKRRFGGSIHALLRAWGTYSYGGY